MSIIYEIETLNDVNLNIRRKKSKKTQIVLFDTQRRIDDFVNKIKYRKNGTYTDIPHFIVSKLGFVYEVFNTNHSSITFNNTKIDNRQIKIAIENLGWLNKNTINGFLYNWIGDTYRSEPYIKGWRNHYYWDKYNDDQIKVVFTLCKEICEKHNINPQIVPSQGFFQNANKFNGIVCKSNFSDIYTDINPSFNFELFSYNEKTDINI